MSTGQNGVGTAGIGLAIGALLGLFALFCLCAWIATLFM